MRNSRRSITFKRLKILGCCPCLCPWYSSNSSRYRSCVPGQMEYHRDRGQLEKQCPLPANRERALTLPLPFSGSGDRRRQWTSDQSESALLSRLPYDIRIMIWEMAVGGKVLHILRGTRKLGCMICQNTEALLEKGSCNCRWPKHSGGFANLDATKSSEATKVFALLRTCRLV